MKPGPLMLLLAGTLLCSCSQPVEAPTVDVRAGLTRAEVIEQLGPPSGTMGHGSYEMLSYERASVELEDGVVTGVRVFTPAEIKARKKLAAAPRKKKAPAAPPKRKSVVSPTASASAPARPSGGGSGKSSYYRTSAKAHAVLDKARTINREKAREMNR